jgi:hypothetical protein
MIKSINYNWFFSPKDGEEFTNRTVGLIYGKAKCDKITQHCAVGEGDKWFYDIFYSDGTVERIFNPNEVFFTDNNTLCQ